MGNNYSYDSGWLTKRDFFHKPGTYYTVRINSQEVENISEVSLIQWIIISDNGSAVEEIIIVNATEIPITAELAYFRVQIWSSYNFTAEVDIFFGPIRIATILPVLTDDPMLDFEENGIDSNSILLGGIIGGTGLIIGILIGFVARMRMENIKGSD